MVETWSGCCRRQCLWNWTRRRCTLIPWACAHSALDGGGTKVGKGQACACENNGSGGLVPRDLEREELMARTLSPLTACKVPDVPKGWAQWQHSPVPKMKRGLLYSSASLELISWKWVLSMFWKGRKGEKRLRELITVRNYFNCLPEFRKPNEQRRKGIRLIRHLREQMESKQMPRALPNEGCTLQEKNLFLPPQ